VTVSMLETATVPARHSRAHLACRVSFPRECAASRAMRHPTHSNYTSQGQDSQDTGVEPMKQRPRLHLVTKLVVPDNGVRNSSHLLPHLTPVAGVPAIIACVRLDLHADIGADLVGRVPILQQPIFAKDRVGSEVPLVDHRTHACSSRRGMARMGIGGRPPTPAQCAGAAGSATHTRNRRFR
jgi:hypothetical protein